MAPAIFQKPRRGREVGRVAEVQEDREKGRLAQHVEGAGPDAQGEQSGERPVPQRLPCERALQFGSGALDGWLWSLLGPPTSGHIAVARIVFSIRKTIDEQGM